MKDNLFEMLLNLFEKSLNQLQKSQQSLEQNEEDGLIEDPINTEDRLYIKAAQHNSTRIFTYEEQTKFTKPSYQFLMRMKLLNIIDDNLFEEIINQLQFSESRIVTLQETKWTIRTVLATHLDEKQLAFLDIVLYPIEDALTVN